MSVKAEAWVVWEGDVSESCWEKFGSVWRFVDSGILREVVLGSGEGLQVLWDEFGMVQGVEGVKVNAGILSEFGGWIWKDLKELEGLVSEGRRRRKNADFSGRGGGRNCWLSRSLWCSLSDGKRC